MHTIHWVTTHGHELKKECATLTEAETFAYLHRFFELPHIARVWVDDGTQQTWLKEKATS